MTSFAKQVWLIFQRNFRHLTRSPKILRAHAFNVTVVSLLILSIYGNMGQFPDLTSFPHTEKGLEDAKVAYAQYVQNVQGFSFLFAN